MKRDMDLVRKILFKLEEKDDPAEWIPPEAIGEYLPEQVSYHIMLLEEAGLIEARDISSTNQYNWAAMNLTWDGHEFLEASRNESIWNKAKALFGEKGAGLTFEVLKELLIKLTREHVLG